MSIEEDIQKTAGVPQSRTDRPKPKAKELETLVLKDGVRFCLKSVEYYDDVEKKYREPRLDYQVQFKRANPVTKADEYVRVPFAKTEEEFELMIAHCQNMMKIMKGADVDFERATTVVSDVNGSVDFIRSTFKNGAQTKPQKK